MLLRLPVSILAAAAALALGVPAAAADDGDAEAPVPANVCTVCVPHRVPPPVIVRSYGGSVPSPMGHLDGGQ